MQRIGEKQHNSRASKPRVSAHPRKLLSSSRSCTAMSRLPLQGARFSQPPRSLCALLALLLVAQQGPLASAGPVAAVVRELRCICLTTQSIHPSLITKLQLILPGPHCSRLEILATLKGLTQQVCLDPQAPRIKRYIQDKLNNNNQKNMKNTNRTLRRLSSSEPISVRSQ